MEGQGKVKERWWNNIRLAYSYTREVIVMMINNNNDNDNKNKNNENNINEKQRGREEADHLCSATSCGVRCNQRDDMQVDQTGLHHLFSSVSAVPHLVVCDATKEYLCVLRVCVLSVCVCVCCLGGAVCVCMCVCCVCVCALCMGVLCRREGGTWSAAVDHRICAYFQTTSSSRDSMLLMCRQGMPYFACVPAEPR